MSDTPDDKLAESVSPDSGTASAPVDSPAPATPAADPASVTAASLAEEQKEQKLEAQRDKRETMLHLICLAVAFLLPMLFLILTGRDDRASTTVYHAFRLGATSFFMALAILGLAQIDRKFNNTSYDFRSQILAGLLGMMLWLVWVGSGQMVFKAVDESKAGSGAFDAQ